MLIALVNQKGGVGKTTLALNAAAHYARRGAFTCLVDADPQRTATHWRAAAKEPSFPVVEVDERDVVGKLASLRDLYEIVVVDTPPQTEKIPRAAIIAADVALIPVEPSAASHWASARILPIVRSAREINPALKAAFVVSRRLINTVIGRAMPQQFATDDVAVLPACVEQRVCYSEAMTLGLSIYDLHARLTNKHERVRVERAVSEIDALMHEVERLHAS